MKNSFTQLITFLITLLLSIFSIKSSAQTIGDQGSLKLNGDGDKAIVSDTIFMNMLKGSWGATVKFDSLGDYDPDYQRIIYKVGVLELFYSSHYKRFESEIVVGGNRYEVTTDSALLKIESDVWYNLFATYDGDEFKLYVDGNLVDVNDTPNGFIDNNIGDWGIGGAVGFNTRTFKGEIDEVLLARTVIDSLTIKDFVCHPLDSTSTYNNSVASYFQFNYLNDTSTVDSWFNLSAKFNQNAKWKPQGYRDDELEVSFDGLQLTSNITGDEFTWFHDGEKMTGENDSILVLTEGGSYSLMVTKGNCTYNSDVMHIIYNSIGKAQKTNIVQVFPNPSNGQLTVQFEEEINNGRLTIYSITGDIIYDQKINNTTTIYLDDIQAKGIYVLSVSKNGETLCIEKLVIN